MAPASRSTPSAILVVVELAGGNDGLNTVIPYGDPAYYRVRPNLGIREPHVLKAAEGFGFHPSMVGFERLYKDGMLGVVHGCGVRPSQPVALLVDGFLAHRCAQRR